MSSGFTYLVTTTSEQVLFFASRGGTTGALNPITYSKITMDATGIVLSTDTYRDSTVTSMRASSVTAFDASGNFFYLALMETTVAGISVFTLGTIDLILSTI